MTDRDRAQMTREQLREPRVQVLGWEDCEDYSVWVERLTARYLMAPSVEDVKLLIAEMAWKLGTLTADLYADVPMERLQPLGVLTDDLGKLTRMLGLDVAWGDKILPFADLILHEGDSVRLTFPGVPPEDAPTIYGRKVVFPIAAEPVLNDEQELAVMDDLTAAFCGVCGHRHTDHVAFLPEHPVDQCRQCGCSTWECKHFGRAD